MIECFDLLLSGYPGRLHPPAPLRRGGGGGLEPDDRHPLPAGLDAGTVWGQLVADCLQDLRARQQRGVEATRGAPLTHVAKLDEHLLDRLKP